MRNLPDKFLGAMIAVLPLPGAPRYGGDDARIIAQALSDVAHYHAAGVDALVLENSHDLPYIKPPLPPRAIKVMQQVADAVRRQFPGPIGLQMLEAANETALYQRKVARDQAASVLAELKKKGMQVHELAPADIDAMKKRAQPVIDKFTKELGEPLVKEVYAEVAKARGAK